MKKNPRAHSETDVARAASLFFTVRGLVRSKLAQGKHLDPYAWLHIETLVYISKHQGRSMKDIAEHLSITAPSATSLIAALAEKGLVERHADSSDKRSLRITLTAKGRAVLKKTLARGMDILASLFASLSPRELAAFENALERIQKGAQEC